MGICTLVYFSAEKKRTSRKPTKSKAIRTVSTPTVHQAMPPKCLRSQDVTNRQQLCLMAYLKCR